MCPMEWLFHSNKFPWTFTSSVNLRLISSLELKHFDTLLEITLLSLTLHVPPGKKWCCPLLSVPDKIEINQTSSCRNITVSYSLFFIFHTNKFFSWSFSQIQSYFPLLFLNKLVGLNIQHLQHLAILKFHFLNLFSESLCGSCYFKSAPPLRC